MENLENNATLRPFQLAEQAPLSIAFLDEQLKIVYLNSSCLNSLRTSHEVSIEQIVGMSLSELLSLSEDQLAIIKSSDNNPVTILPGLTDSSSEVLITPFLDESNPLIGRMAIWKNFLIQDNEESTELSMLQLLAMRSLLSTLSGHKTFETALQATISATSMCFGIPMCCYWEKDLATGDLLQRFAWSYENQTEIETCATIKRGQGGVGKAWQTRLTTFTEDFEQSHDPRLESAEFSSKVRSSIAIPIIAHGNLHGVLEFLSPATLGALSAGIDVFNTLGKILGHFASLNGEPRGAVTQSDDASLQCSIVKAIAGLRDSDQLLQIIVSSVTEHFTWEYGAYWAIENESDFIRTHVGGSVCPNVSRLTLPGDSLVTAAIASLDVVCTADSTRLEDSPRFPEMNRYHLRAGAIIPICNKDQVLGFFEFFTSNPDSLTHSRQNSIRELGELLPSFIINNHANDELQEATKDAEAIGEVVADLAGCQSADEAAMLALNLLAETYEWDFLAYWTWTPDKQSLKSDIQVGEISDSFYDASSELQLAVGAGPVGIAWEQAEFTICDLNEHADNNDPRVEAALAEGADTAIYMPILENGEIVSLIEVILKNSQGFSKSKQSNLKLLHTTLDNAFNRILKLCEQVEANQNSDSLSTLMERIDKAHTYDTTVQVALDSIRELFDWDYGTYFDYNSDSQALTFHSSTGTLSEEYSELTRTTEYTLGEGLLGSTIENQETVTFPVIDQMPDSEPRKANAIEAGCQTYLAIPIFIEEKIFGVLEFYLTYQQSFSTVRVGALKSISKIIGNALQKALQQQEKLALEQEQKEKTNSVLRFVNEVENGNLVAELNIQGQDPIGRIASGLRNLVSTIRSIFEQFSQFGQDLAEAARKMSEASEQLNKNADQTSNQSLEAQSASQTAHETAQAVAAAAEEMSASISEISKNVSEASAITNSATRRADEAMKLVVSLGQRSEEIGEVVKLINSIASQTNLLALNATIEAARAGEVGRGFAVVANEVKELARGTANATQEISTKISGVQAETTSVIDIMKEIADTIVNLSTLSQGVTGSISQQSSTTAEISQSIGNAAQQIGVIGSRISTVTDLAAHTKQAAHESATDSSTLNTMANQLIQMLKIYKLR